VNKSISSWVAALCGVVVMVLSVSAASAERRVALVVGNSQYKNSNLVLFNPRRDAEDVAATLRSLGFEVILTLDASKRDFDSP
jgi:Caspase domain